MGTESPGPREGSQKRPLSFFMFQNNPRFHYDRELSAGRGVACFVLDDPLVYESSVNGGNCRVEVPAGFATDFASVPRFFWRIMPPIDCWWRAAAMHDYLLEKTTASKFLCDAMFREGLRADGVNGLRQFVMYVVVRLFGGRTRR